MPATFKTPLILLVGFLGAGKTTYLRHLLPSLKDRGIDAHVVINDYQNARVDAELLSKLSDSITPISGSCVCCGSKEELVSTLQNFSHTQNRIALVETNGTTDAEEVIELLSLEPSLNHFTQPIQVSVIDGQRWQKRFWHNALELAQTRTANYLFISRWEELDEKRKSKVDQSLEKNRVSARRMSPVEFASEIVSIASDELALPARHLTEAASRSRNAPHEHRSYHFASMQIPLAPAVSKPALEGFLALLPKEVIRVKGLVTFDHSPNEFHVFQKVDNLPVNWFPIGQSSRLKEPVIVLIGPTIDHHSILKNAAPILGPRH